MDCKQKFLSLGKGTICLKPALLWNKRFSFSRSGNRYRRFVKHKMIWYIETVRKRPKNGALDPNKHLSEFRGRYVVLSTWKESRKTLSWCLFSILARFLKSESITETARDWWSVSIEEEDLHRSDRREPTLLNEERTEMWGFGLTLILIQSF